MTREAVASERVDERVLHWPEHCGCGHAFGGDEQTGRRSRDPPTVEAAAGTGARDRTPARLFCPGCGRGAGPPARPGAVGLRPSPRGPHSVAGARRGGPSGRTIHFGKRGWHPRAAQQWLWVAASALYACYRIDPPRSQRAAKALIREDFNDFAAIDRDASYHFLDVLEQQLR